MADIVTRVRDSDMRARVTILETQIGSIANNIDKLEQKVEGQYQTLHSRISDMRDDLRSEIDKKHDQMMSMLKEHMDAELQHHEAMRDKISTIEKWRWMIMGAAGVIGYVIAHIKLDKLF
jgi:chromosome segregation ATPase